MRRSKLFSRVATLLLATALATALSSAARADAVTRWNALMQTTVSSGSNPNSNPNYQTRWGAIVQLAVFEAVNAITGDYEPYLGDITAPSWASPEAAVIVAAHDTLVAVRPGSAPMLDLERDADLAAIDDGPEKEAGIAVGEAAAAAMLLLRVDDGWDDTVPYMPGNEPGDFQPPPTGAFLPHWGQVTPFGIQDGSQFPNPAPPALHTGTYAIDYNEVKLLGRSGENPFRPQDRTDVARFYAATSPVNVFNPAARQVSEAQGLTLSENARVFALLAMAMADASIACWDAKYEYNFWRPQTAIQQGDLDGNNLTDKDASWTPLITTPAHPSYASGHASVGSAAAAVLERVFGKDGHAIVLTHSGLGIVLMYSAWEEIGVDVDDARVYGGIHFRFDQEVGAHQGRQVGRYILRNYLRAPEELEDED